LNKKAQPASEPDEMGSDIWQDVKGASVDRSAGALYVVATPIGNLQDITLRALSVLKECDLIASEDTRTALKLLNRFDIHTPVTSYHQHSGGRKSNELVDKIRDGAAVALISEAGTPAISDPGHELIQACIDEGIRVVPIPGVSAVISLLSAAGLNTSAFIFLGFPPRKTGERRKYFQDLSTEARTMVFYESPNRIRDTLGSIAQAFGEDRRVVIGREMTKLFEEIWRGTVSDCVIEFTDRRPRGEFALAVAGAHPVSNENVDLEQEYRRLIAEGMDDKSVLAALSRLSGWPRREVYAAILKWKGKK